MSKFGWSYPPGAANDPYAPYNQEEEDYVSPLLEALKEWDTGRWQWDGIHICVTGKDADLEWHGQQGIHVDDADDEVIHATMHVGATHAGTDVCLNAPEHIEDDADLYYKYMDLYLEQATEVVCGCGVAGEWDGDSWYFSDSVAFTCKWVTSNEEEGIDYKATAQAVYDAAQEAIKPIEAELKLMSDILNRLAGWRDEGNKQCPPGQPPEFSIFSHKLKQEGGPHA